MSINLSCGGCKKSFQVKDDLAGKRVKCPGCKIVVPVPALDDDEPDDAEQQQSTKSVPKRFPLPWVAAGAAALLLLLSLPLALYGIFAASSAKSDLAAAEARSREALAALNIERAGLEDKLRGTGSEVDKLKQRLTDTEQLTIKGKADADKFAQRATVAEAQLAKAKAEADDLRKQLETLLAKLGEKGKPPPAPGPDADEMRELIVGRWRDVKNAKGMPGGKSWGDMEFTSDGKLALTVRDIKTSKPLTLNGQYKVLDDGKAEITVNGKTTKGDFDTPPWITLDMEAALMSGGSPTKKVPISVSKTELTFAGINYERVEAGAVPPEPKMKAGVKITTIVRARRVLLNDGKELTPTDPMRDVAYVLKVEGVPAKVIGDGLELFSKSHVVAGGQKKMFSTISVSLTGGDFIVATGVIPATARKMTLHFNGMPAINVDLPAKVLDSVKEVK